MNIPGERFPCLVDKAATFVKEAAAVLIDNDPVRVHQHDRRGMMAARVDRLNVHAVPIARNTRALLRRHAYAVTGIETRSGRDEPEGLGARPELRTHHRRIALESTAGENDGICIGSCCDTLIARLNVHANKATSLLLQQPAHPGIVKNPHAGLFCSFEKLFNDNAAASDRLDTGRTGAEIIDWRDEFDPVCLEPSNRCGRIRPRARENSFDRPVRRKP